MPIVHLNDRAVIAVSGPDAEHLLQNIVTADLAALGADAAKPCALLTPQGKILFDFLISRSGDTGFDLECRADVADDFIRRLMLYRLRAKAEIAKREQAVVTVSWQDDSAPSHSDSTASRIESTGLADLRFPEALRVRRHFSDAARENATTADWTLLRIGHGVAESGADYELGDAFPHDVLLDQNGGVGFRKGCFVGQEVVSRMQHRGTARRRVLIAEADADLPAPQTAILADGRPVGALGSGVGTHGLAMVRIDKVKDAIDAGKPLTTGEVFLRLAIPPHVDFDFPRTAGGDA